MSKRKKAKVVGVTKSHNETSSKATSTFAGMYPAPMGSGSPLLTAAQIVAMTEAQRQAAWMAGQMPKTAAQAAIATILPTLGTGDATPNQLNQLGPTLGGMVNATSADRVTAVNMILSGQSQAVTETNDLAAQLAANAKVLVTQPNGTVTDGNGNAPGTVVAPPKIAPMATAVRRAQVTTIAPVTITGTPATRLTPLTGAASVGLGGAAGWAASRFAALALGPAIGVGVGIAGLGILALKMMKPAPLPGQPLSTQAKPLPSR